MTSIFNGTFAKNSNLGSYSLNAPSTPVLTTILFIIVGKTIQLLATL